MQHENRKLCFLSFPSLLLAYRCHILFQLFDRVIQSCPRIINFIDNQDVLSNQVFHLQRGEIKPLGACDLCANLFDGVSTKLFVEGETDGLDRNVGMAGLFEKRAIDTLLVKSFSWTCCETACMDVPKDSSWDVSSSTDGYDEVWTQVIEDLSSGSLAHFVHLSNDHGY
jgi:hypothetical protein